MTTTVAALFSNKDAAEAAVKDLHDIGVSGDHISVVTSDYKHNAITNAPPFDTTGEIAGAGAVTGTVFGGTMGLLVGLGALAIPGIGPVLAAGPLLAAIGAMAAGAGIGAAAGGLLGGLVSAGVPEEDAHVYAEGVRRGDTLVMVNVIDGVAKPVTTVLEWHKPVNVEQRAAELREGGWTKFDTEAKPFEGDAVATYEAMTHSNAMAEPPPTAPNTDAPEAAQTFSPEASPPKPVQSTPLVAAKVPEKQVAVGAATLEASDPFYTHYQQTFAASGKPFENYGPVYRYGERLAHNPQYRANDWNAVEPVARHEWEQNNPNTWDEIKEAVRYAWDRTKSTL